ncbi:YbaK/EbsC family protein [Nitrogeniibacter mangrovi]|uniref:YbaK/EbsC family protein n=1 Tax=Nitrogeniibacter mangrovi TaxID=2016596 RepID=A0A6C1B4R5_9RHOO|nr:YbaK/EbsC family protein [Nitrogeniibacter mangrovi]QID18423.1 YbaK/EbsC family protein [Nitrogeniibacter mangrovi]
MTIPKRLSQYLDERGLHYHLRTHEPSHTTAQSARKAHVLPYHMAKPVLLEDDTGYLMAVVPADRDVHIGTLARMLDRHDLHLADEARIAQMFSDCDLGAMPPVGMAWGIDMIVDDTLEACDTIYMEAGDHETLLQMTHEDFHMLVRDMPHGKICRRMMH